MEGSEAQTVGIGARAEAPVPHPGISHLYDFTITQLVDGVAVGGVCPQIVARGLDADTDGDGTPDVDDPDDDDDGFTDEVEIALGTNPLDPDSVPGSAGTPTTETRVSSYRLYPAEPSPFRSGQGTRIRFDLPAAGTASLELFDVSGRLVRTFSRSDQLDAGRHSLIWDGRDDHGRRLASGVYLYRLRAGSFHDAQRLVLME